MEKVHISMLMVNLWSFEWSWIVKKIQTILVVNVRREKIVLTAEIQIVDQRSVSGIQKRRFAELRDIWISILVCVTFYCVYNT